MPIIHCYNLLFSGNCPSVLWRQVVIYWPTLEYFGKSRYNYRLFTIRPQRSLNFHFLHWLPNISDCTMGKRNALISHAVGNDVLIGALLFPGRFFFFCFVLLNSSFAFCCCAFLLRGWGFLVHYIERKARTRRDLRLGLHMDFGFYPYSIHFMLLLLPVFSFVLLAFGLAEWPFTSAWRLHRFLLYEARNSRYSFPLSRNMHFWPSLVVSNLEGNQPRSWIIHKTINYFWIDQRVAPPFSPNDAPFIHECQ